MLLEKTATFLEEARQWTSGRSPWLRMLLWGWLFWIFCHHLQDPLYRSLFGGLNLGIHELGHVLAIPLGMTLQIAAGTFAQCMAPVLSSFLFYRQQDYFAIGLSLCWLGTNLYEAATYSGDALIQQLPLVSPFAGIPIHDWNFLLERWGLLSQAKYVSRLFHLGGSISFLAGLAFTAWLIAGMFRRR